jgi:hypothetical protein
MNKRETQTARFLKCFFKLNHLVDGVTCNAFTLLNSDVTSIAIASIDVFQKIEAGKGKSFVGRPGIGRSAEGSFWFLNETIRICKTPNVLTLNSPHVDPLNFTVILRSF